MIVRSGSTRLRGMGVPYWDLPAANRIGYWANPGGFKPLQVVAAENQAAPPSEALLTAVNKLRHVGGPHVGDLPIPRTASAPVNRRGSSSNYGLFRNPVARPSRGMRGFRGLGDCLNAAVDSMGMCPDGSSYTGALDSGGAAPSGGLSFPWFTGTPAPTPAPSSSSGSSDWAKLAASVLPASFTTLQEAIAQPGQVVKTPTTLITGSGANIANIPGLSTVSSNTGLLAIGAVVVIGGLLIFGSKKR